MPPGTPPLHTHGEASSLSSDLFWPPAPTLLVPFLPLPCSHGTSVPLVLVTHTRVPATCSHRICVFRIPGVMLKHSASSGHSDLKRLLLPAVLEAGEDGSQGGGTELGGSRAYGRAHMLHQLGVRGLRVQAQVPQDSVHAGWPSRGAWGDRVLL